MMLRVALLLPVSLSLVRSYTANLNLVDLHPKITTCFSNLMIQQLVKSTKVE
jgi:hypothetical protein